MSDIAIRVQNLSKQYRIGGRQERFPTLRDRLADAFASPFRRLASTLRGDGAQAATEETIWALKDVSFEVARGEVVGIIGRNGAGKTTLLKILSRITEPTEGEAEIHGRVGSLLEVGTGFHQELTGRENIFLNGAILGMKRAEIEKKFDEIVNFSGVEKFIDTPVKHYSSGMYVRLAFAVAAHLEPEILLVDEVLSVGDAAFQKKCLGKMGEVAKEGRTVLFVSHNMAAVQNLCERAILLSSGNVIKDDKTDLVIEEHLKESMELLEVSLAERTDRRGTGDIRFVSVTFQNGPREDVKLLRTGQHAIFRFHYENNTGRELRELRLAVGIDNQSGQLITVLDNELTDQVFPTVPAEANSIEIHLEQLPLTPGRYRLTIFCTVDRTIADWIQNAALFDVESGDYYGTGRLPETRSGISLANHYYRVAEMG